MTPAELERLAKLAEEASEIVHIAMKIMRHGYYNYNPDAPEPVPNKKLLEMELRDFYKIATRMALDGDITESPHKVWGELKYMHHQETEESEKGINE